MWCRIVFSLGWVLATSGVAWSGGPCAEVKLSAAAKAKPTTSITHVMDAVEAVGKPQKLSLAMFPGRLFAQPVKVDPGQHPIGGPHVEFSFWLLWPGATVKGAQAIHHAELSLCRGATTLETTRLGRQALLAREHKLLSGVMKARKKTALTTQHHVVIPTQLGVDSLVLRVSWTADGSTRRGYRVAVESGRPKTRLRLPLKGWFVALATHTLADHHRGSPGEWYAFDFLSTDAQGAWLKDTKWENRSFVGWEQPLLAVADGTITDCRDDIPDNKRPMDVPNMTEFYKKYGPRNRSAGGTFVVIDHGNGEFSYYAHLRQGSLKVKKGERVKVGQVLGLMGNSGHSGAPHLHYHLMACATPFACTGVPAYFHDVLTPFTKKPAVYRPARGIPVKSAPPPKP